MAIIGFLGNQNVGVRDKIKTDISFTKTSECLAYANQAMVGGERGIKVLDDLPFKPAAN